ncbi:MAG: NAD(P)-binding domain-containing protein [Desulfobulbaceae bacterium]|nr:NAD(P)-binding domain-containing protein [Desulfobulbaceae bacterium]
MEKVLFIGPSFAEKHLQEMFDPMFALVPVPPEPNALASALADAAAVLDASMQVRITDAMVTNAPKLRIISCATTGSDHIERGELDKRRIPVRTLREDQDLLQNLTPAAELTWTLFMALARKIPAALAHVRSGGWNRELFPGVMFNGKRLGVIGCGRIGGWVARYAQAFGMDVVGHDPFVAQFPAHIREVSLKELAETSDFISIHVHLSDQTRQLMSRDLFERIKPGAFFVNTSRGGVADEVAMLEALSSGRLAGAGLDVLSFEPDIEGTDLARYAREHDNLIITPHCGGFSPDAVVLVCARAAAKIVEHLGS